MTGPRHKSWRHHVGTIEKLLGVTSKSLEGIINDGAQKAVLGSNVRSIETEFEIHQQKIQLR